MALAHNPGFPHRDRKLTQARDGYRQGELDEAGLRAVGRELRAAHWQAQQDAGLELLAVGDFAWHDPLLNHSLLFGVVPEDCRDGVGRVGLASEFAMAAAEHYRVPEFSAEQKFRLSWEQLFEEVEEARALGHAVKPVLIGPLTYLWLGKAKDDAFDKLELLERLLPVYGEVLGRLAGLGVEWVQIDEPILGLELPQAWRTAFERAYNLLQAPKPQKLLATRFAGPKDNLGLAATLPVAGLHVDLSDAPEQLPALLDRLPAYKVLSLGVLDGSGDLALLHQAQQRVGERLWVAPSRALLQGAEDGAPQCQAVAHLARALDQPQVQAA